MEDNLYYYRARYYDSNMGRFISQDPIGFQSDVNFYRYVYGNPVNGVDPSGLFLKGKYWGNYCGDDWCGGEKRDERDYPPLGKKPIPATDSLDQCCKEHDACLGGWDPETGVPVPPKDHKYCDMKMAECLDKIDPCDLMDERPDIDPNKTEHKLRYIRNVFARFSPF